MSLGGRNFNRKGRQRKASVGSSMLSLDRGIKASELKGIGKGVQNDLD
jgi:hypothetical protein